MRPRLRKSILRILGLALLWLPLVWSLSLVTAFLSDPVLAQEMQHQLHGIGSSALWITLVAASLLALNWPPFLPAIRYGWQRMLANLRVDRSPLLKAQTELRRFESGPGHLEAGRAAIGARDFQAAIGHLLRSLEMDPDRPAALYLLGQAMIGLGRPDQALRPLLRAVEIEPGHAFGSALLWVGRAWMLVGQHEKASAALRRHQRDHGGSRRSGFWLGQCRKALGDAEGAAAAFQQAAALHSGNVAATAEEAFYGARARAALSRLRRGTRGPRPGGTEGGGDA